MKRKLIENKTLFSKPTDYINIKTYVVVRKIIHTVLVASRKSKYHNRVSTNPRNSNPCKSRTYYIYILALQSDHQTANQQDNQVCYTDT
jgi:hypothetical protein